IGIPISADVIVRERQIANCCVLSGVDILKQRGIAKRVVAASVRVVKERETATGVVEIASVVINHCVHSRGRVLGAGSVEQHRCRANCGIGIRMVKDERSSTNASAKAGASGEKERVPPDSGVSSATGEVGKGIAPFGGRKSRIAAVRRRRWKSVWSCMHVRQKRNA